MHFCLVSSFLNSYFANSIDFPVPQYQFQSKHNSHDCIQTGALVSD